jgi:hypothetical protein
MLERGPVSSLSKTTAAPKFWVWSVYMRKIGNISKRRLVTNDIK